MKRSIRSSAARAASFEVNDGRTPSAGFASSAFFFSSSFPSFPFFSFFSASFSGTAPGRSAIFGPAGVSHHERKPGLESRLITSFGVGSSNASSTFDTPPGVFEIRSACAFVMKRTRRACPEPKSTSSTIWNIVRALSSANFWRSSSSSSPPSDEYE